MDSHVETIIGVNVSLKGSLYNRGPIQINGSVEGEVKSDEDIIIGDSAKITGPVIAKKIEISGEVTGTITASEKLEINGTGKVSGDICAKTLIIKEGAIFNGTSNMSENSSPKIANPVKTEPEKKSSTPEINEKTVPAEDKFGFFVKK